MIRRERQKRDEWWVVSQGLAYLWVECEGFRSRAAAERWRDEHYAEGMVLRVNVATRGARS